MQMKFYSPLTADFFPNDTEDLDDDYSEYEGIPYTGKELTGYRDVIRDAIYEDVKDFYGDLMRYYREDDSVRRKVVRAIPTVDEVNGELVGSLWVDTDAPLTAEEQAVFCAYISGQYSDGWGEGFEQREIDVGDGKLYVHFWQDHDFELKRDVPDMTEFKKLLNRPKKPKMQLIGQDGNIFAIMGRASRLLKSSGQGDKAKEMRDRVMSCDSYQKALSIVSEYVETELSPSPMSSVSLPQELIDAINNVGFWDSIPLWAVTLIGGLLITVLSFTMILTVYGRMFSLWMYAAIAPIPLSTFAGEPTSSVGKNFIRSYAGVCLQGVVIALSCIIFSAISSSPPAVDTGASVVTAVWTYVGELAFNLLVLVGAIKGCDRIVKEIMGL